MNEDFVSEETARLAKKANFNEPCLFFTIMENYISINLKGD